MSKFCVSCNDKLSRFRTTSFCSTCKIMDENNIVNLESFANYLQTRIGEVSADLERAYKNGSDPEYFYGKKAVKDELEWLNLIYRKVLTKGRTR